MQQGHGLGQLVGAFGDVEQQVTEDGFGLSGAAQQADVGVAGQHGGHQRIVLDHQAVPAGKFLLQAQQLGGSQAVQDLGAIGGHRVRRVAADDGPVSLLRVVVTGRL